MNLKKYISPKKGPKPTKDDKERMEGLEKKVEEIHELKNILTDSIREEKGYARRGDVVPNLIDLEDDIIYDWTFKKISKKDLERIITNIKYVKESVKNIDDL